jgi:hypothetical protein
LRGAPAGSAASPQQACPLIGLARLPECSQAAAPARLLGWRATPLPLQLPRSHRLGRCSTLGTITPLPIHGRSLARGYPLPGLGSLSECHQYATAPAGAPWQHPGLRPFRGLVPFSVFPAARSHLAPADPNLPVTLRPQGFPPSRRVAPLTTCRAILIPVPLMGFSLRGLGPPAVPYALSGAAPLGVRYLSGQRDTPLQGLTHDAQPGARPGVQPGRLPPFAPLGFHRFGVSCPRPPVRGMNAHPPLSRFLGRTRAGPTAGAPGSPAAGSQPLSSRDRHDPHAVFHLVDPLGDVGVAAGRGYEVPRKPANVTVDPRLLFALRSIP